MKQGPAQLAPRLLPILTVAITGVAQAQQFSPSVEAFSPGSGSGISSTFVLTVSDPNGFGDINIVNLLINSALDGRNACYVAFVRSTNTVSLVNDAGDAGGPFAGSLTLGSGTASNSQCTINGSGSSAVSSGTTLTLSLNITFQSVFFGNRVPYAAVRDTIENNSGWQPGGVWTIPPVGPSPNQPWPVSFTPASGSGDTMLLETIVQDANGATDLNIINVLINNAVDGRSACYVAYIRSSNTLSLVNDAGDAGGPFAGSIVLGGTGAASNSQCTIFASGSSGTASGNALTLRLNLSFMGSFGGRRIFYVAGRDVAENNSGWQPLGTRNIPIPANPTISRFSDEIPQNGIPSDRQVVVTALGSGAYDLSLRAKVVGGNPANIREMRLRLGNAPGPGFACNMIADPASSVLYLEDDLGDWGPWSTDRYINGGYLLAGRPPSVSGALKDWPNNSQCTLEEEHSSVTFNGDEVTAKFRIFLKPHVKGRLGISAFSKYCPASGACSSPSNTVNSSLATFGEMAAPLLAAASQPLVRGTGFRSNVGDFKVGGVHGNREVFYVRYEHQNGVQQIRYAYLNINSSPAPSSGGSNSCQFTFNVWTNQLDFAGAGSVMAGSASSTQNGQCQLYAQASRAQYLSPTELLVRFDVEFLTYGQRYLHRAAAIDPPPDPAALPWSNPDAASYLAEAPAVGGTTSLTAFQDCLKSSATQHITCVLAAGEHLVSNTLLIQRSNITIRGASKYGTILKRAPSFNAAMMKIRDDQDARSQINLPQYTNITIRDLTFDGSRPGGESVSPGGGTDLDIANVDGTTSGTPGVLVTHCRFINGSNSAISMQPALHFVYAKQLGLWPAGYAPGYTRGIRIENNEFRRSLRAPIHIGLAGAWWPGPSTPTDVGTPVDVRGTCDGTPLAEFNQEPGATPNRIYTGLSAFRVRDVLIKNNFFENNDTGAFGINSTTDVTVQNNAMLDNYDRGLDCGGGVVAILSCGRSVNVLDNFLWNRNVTTWPELCDAREQLPLSDPLHLTHNNRLDKFAISDGFEVWGKNITIQGNWVEYMPKEGATLNSVAEVTVQNNRFRNNSRGFQNVFLDNEGSTINYDDDAAGIRMATCEGEAKVSRAYSTVNILGNELGNVTASYLGCTAGNVLGCLQTIFQSYGVRVGRDVCSGDPTGTMSNVAISTDPANPLNRNRQGSSCRVGGITFPQSSVPVCNELVTLWSPANCTTAGCQ